MSDVAAEIERFVAGLPEATEPELVLATVLAARIAAGQDQTSRPGPGRGIDAVAAGLDRFGAHRLERGGEEWELYPVASGDLEPAASRTRSPARDPSRDLGAPTGPDP